MEKAGWKGEVGSSILEKGQREFYDEIARAAERFGYLSLYFLTVDDRIVAGHFGLTYRGQYFMPKVAYDEEFALYSPGHLIVQAIVQDCAARGVRRVDMMGDAEEWKMRWTATVRPHSYGYVFAKGVRGRALHAAKFKAAPALKRLLARKED